VNINFLTEKLPYSQIYSTKVGPSYKNGVIAQLTPVLFGWSGEGGANVQSRARLVDGMKKCSENGDVSV